MEFVWQLEFLQFVGAICIFCVFAYGIYMTYVALETCYEQFIILYKDYKNGGLFIKDSNPRKWHMKSIRKYITAIVLINLALVFSALVCWFTSMVLLVYFSVSLQ